MQQTLRMGALLTASLVAASCAGTTRTESGDEAKETQPASTAVAGNGASSGVGNGAPEPTSVDDADLTARINRAWDEHLAHRLLPRQLPGLLRRAGFRVETVGLTPVLNTDHDPNTYGFGLIDLMADFARGRAGARGGLRRTGRDDRPRSHLPCGAGQRPRRAVAPPGRPLAGSVPVRTEAGQLAALCHQRIRLFPAGGRQARRTPTRRAPLHGRRQALEVRPRGGLPAHAL